MSKYVGILFAMLYLIATVPAIIIATQSMVVGIGYLVVMLFLFVLLSVRMFK